MWELMRTRVNWVSNDSGADFPIKKAQLISENSSGWLYDIVSRTTRERAMTILDFNISKLKDCIMIHPHE